MPTLQSFLATTGWLFRSRLTKYYDRQWLTEEFFLWPKSWIRVVTNCSTGQVRTYAFHIKLWMTASRQTERSFTITLLKSQAKKWAPEPMITHIPWRKWTHKIIVHDISLTLALDVNGNQLSPQFQVKSDQWRRRNSLINDLWGICPCNRTCRTGGPVPCGTSIIVKSLLATNYFFFLDQY